MFDFCAGEPDFLFLCVPLLCGVFACILRVRASLRDGCGLCTRQPGCAQFPPLLAFLTACGDVTYVRLLPYSGDAWRYASLGPLFNSDKFRSSSGSWCCTYPATFAGWVPIRARADDVALVERVCV